MCYDKVLSINSENEEALLEKGNLYSKENTDNLAIQSYKKALDVNPNNVDALMNMGMEHANIGEIEEAIVTHHDPKELKTCRSPGSHGTVHTEHGVA